MTLLLTPAEDSQRAEGVPWVWMAHGLTEGDGEHFVAGGIEKPSAVWLPFAFDEAHSIRRARVASSRLSRGHRRRRSGFLLMGWGPDIGRQRISGLPTG